VSQAETINYAKKSAHWVNTTQHQKLAISVWSSGQCWSCMSGSC